MEKPEQDHYGILKITIDCTPIQIKKAYRKQSLIHHPDKHVGKPTYDNAHLLTVQINFAYEVLSERDKREAYNARYDHIVMENARYEEWLKQQTKPSPETSTDKPTKSADQQATAEDADDDGWEYVQPDHKSRPNTKPTLLLPPSQSRPTIQDTPREDVVPHETDNSDWFKEGASKDREHDCEKVMYTYVACGHAETKNLAFSWCFCIRSPTHCPFATRAIVHLRGFCPTCAIKHVDTDAMSAIKRGHRSQ